MQIHEFFKELFELCEANFINAKKSTISAQ